jgi:hypothetical protein
VFLARTNATSTEAEATTLIDDPTDRADTTCRTYSAAAPITLGPTQGVVVGVNAKFPSGANEVVIQRLTLTLGT